MRFFKEIKNRFPICIDLNKNHILQYVLPNKVENAASFSANRNKKRIRKLLVAHKKTNLKDVYSSYSHIITIISLGRWTSVVPAIDRDDTVYLSHCPNTSLLLSLNSNYF